MNSVLLTMGNSATKSVSDVIVLEDYQNDFKKSNAEELNDSPSSMPDSPPSKVVIVTGADLKEGVLSNASSMETRSLTDDTESLISSVSDYDFTPSVRCKTWDRKALYSDMINNGLQYLKKSNDRIVMLFEAPSTAATDSSFTNGQVYKFHDYPPTSSLSKAVLGPCRYSMMNGSTFPSFLRDGTAPIGLMEHWQRYVPNFAPPRFVNEITDEDTVYAYLPVESIRHHVNDPHVHCTYY
jgi:hypothetical protein